MNSTSLILIAAEAAVKAGEEILKIYQTDFDVEHKADASPLTLADKAAHETIKNSLSGVGIPMLSEEGNAIEYDERKNWKELWIIDPLDGTKEFVKRNGEFTVNIALIRNNYPVLGVIYVPVTSQLFFAAEDLGSFLMKSDTSSELLNSIKNNSLFEKAIKLPDLRYQADYCRIVASRSHMSPETEEFIAEQEKRHKKVELVSMGSSLKICLVAEGKAELYPRFAPTMEWDTAAGQAIAEAAGKQFIDYTTGERMRYNRENLLNNWFLVS